MPPLSIVTITKDDPRGVERTLASAAALQARGVEHIVVDGSAVEDFRLLASAANGVTVLRREARGISDAFNVGIGAARGEWLWFLNGGDTVDARLSAEFVLELLAKTRGDVLIAGTTYEGEANPRPHPPVELRWPPFRSWIPHPSTVVRRKLFEQFGLFDERYTIAMDYEWWLRVIPTGVGVDVINLPLAVFAPGGLSQRPEMLPTIVREQRAALRRHQSAIGAGWSAVTLRLLRAWWRAQWSRRGRSPNASG